MGNTGDVRRLLLAAVVMVLAAGCGSGGGTTQPTGSTVAQTVPPRGREEVSLSVPASLRGGELSDPHQLEVPKGWKASVYARVSGARMEAITPEGNLLVSVPGEGKVLELSGKGNATKENTLLEGLESSQGLAFAKVAG